MAISALNLAWWVVPLLWVLVVAYMFVEVRMNPMFKRASPYMNAMDAWGLAFYTHMSERNGLSSAGVHTPPPGSSLHSNAWWKILSGVGVGAFFIGKKIYGGRKKDSAAETSDTNRNIETIKKAASEGKEPTEIEKDTTLNQATNLTRATESETTFAERAQDFDRRGALLAAEVEAQTAHGENISAELMERVNAMMEEGGELDQIAADADAAANSTMPREEGE